MSSFCDIPRDVIKQIVSKMDIDTKIKLGLIFKMKVPDEITKEISRCLQVPGTLDGIENWWCIKLGPYVFPNDKEYTTYMLQRFTAYGAMVYLTTHAIEAIGTVNFSTHDVEGEFDDS
jgi:hypothetical protein